MSDRQRLNIRMSTQNLMNICVDETARGEIGGRIYHSYSKEPVIFHNVVELMRKIDLLLDHVYRLRSSTKARFFLKQEALHCTEKPSLVLTIEEVLSHTGEKGTFATSVQFRQNATWQGDVTWMEKGQRQSFQNELDFIKVIHNALAVE